jgi:hypothetical protein
LVEYALTTVTYGVASSPYQALRVLHQLERDEGHKFKRALGVLTTETYVDDITTGAETIPDTLTLQRQVTKLLDSGGLGLKKWASNCPAVLQDVPAEDRVTDLSTPAFIAALHRFVLCRDIPMNIYSDCGTNFQGADNVLRIHLQDPAAQDLFSAAIPRQWHSNPLAAPHFGGLWEAAIKSVKYHLKRVIGSKLFTFEEMTTLTHRIEAVLNSRPIAPMSSDPNDLRALTPGDFLIGSPTLALPDPDVTSTPNNRLSRWQLLNQLQQSF